MLVSRAGDWTSALIDEPPSHVWVRGIPTVGVANVRKLFTKVVTVATGSGIGPVLGHLLDTSAPSRLVWVTKSPRQAYGDAFVDEIESAQPDALIRDTGVRTDLGLVSPNICIPWPVGRHCLCNRGDQGVRRGGARRYGVRQVQRHQPARQGRDG